MFFRPEHPNPQFVRDNWENLNGEWDFAFDFSASGKERGMVQDGVYDKKIKVPFCPESELSGIGFTDFLNAVWYRRSFVITEKQLDGRVFIHFGAVDYLSEVYINGILAGTHKGGFTPFAFDITKLVVAGSNTVVVFARDNNGRDGKSQGRGKQSDRYKSFGCLYTRTTGIWQTVYLEFTPEDYIDSFRVYPDIDNQSLLVKGLVKGEGLVTIEAFYDGKSVGRTEKKCHDSFNAELALSELHLWELGCGRLYDLVITFGQDVVKSYFGMRSVSLGKWEFLLNGKSVFQRLVLDQGYYPDGIYTAKNDETLCRDIILSMEAGFNGARMHEKVFEPRFIYHCDRLGYMVWGEYPNWGLNDKSLESFASILPEWMEELERDFNHPSIVGWCPYNETNGGNAGQEARNLAYIYDITKAFDETRPCIDTSGYVHVKTDIYDIHDYCQDPEEFKEHYASLITDGVYTERRSKAQSWQGQPIFISEYGGTGLSANLGQHGEDPWSYGVATKTAEEFYERYRGLTHALLDNPFICGFCYTQLYDIEQEQNGLYTYDRKPKIDIGVIREINTKKAAIED